MFNEEYNIYRLISILAVVICAINDFFLMFSILLSAGLIFMFISSSMDYIRKLYTSGGDEMEQIWYGIFVFVSFMLFTIIINNGLRT